LDFVGVGVGRVSWDAESIAPDEDGDGGGGWTVRALEVCVRERSRRLLGGGLVT